MAYYFQIADFNLQIYSKVNPDLSGLDFEKKFERGTYTTRNYPGGDVLFCGSDFDLIQSYANDKVAYKLYQNGEILSVGYFFKKGELNITTKRFTTELIIDDVLTDFEEKGKEKYNVLEAFTNEFDILIRNDFYQVYKETFEVLIKTPAGVNKTLTYEGVAQNSKITESVTNGLSTEDPLKTLISADYVIFGIVYEEPPMVFTPGNYFIGTCTTTKISSVGYGTIVNGANVPPVGSGWVYETMVSFGNVSLPKYVKGVDIGTNWTNQNSVTVSGEGETKSLKYINNKSDFFFEEYLVYNRSRKVEDVFKFLVGKINPTITFDANSFKYFNDFETETLTYEGVSSNKPFKDLSIMQLTDAIPNPDLTQKEFKARVGMISFDDFMSYFEEFPFNFKIENNVFSIVHYTEFATNGFNPNYANFKGTNYLNRSNQVEKETASYDNIVNDFKGNSIDFFGGEMRFPNVGLNIDRTISSNLMFTDINDIFRAKSDSYNVESTNQFVLLSLQEVNSKYYLRDATGLVSGERTNNADLSFVNLARDVISNVPDTVTEINEIPQILDSNRKEKLNKAVLKFPLMVFSEVDFNKGVQFFGEVAEFTSVKKEVNENQVEAEIKF